MVELAGRQIRVIQYINVASSTVAIDDYSRLYQKYCPKQTWQISNQADGSNDLAAWMRSTELGYIFGDVGIPAISYVDLGGSSVAETSGEGTGARIALDINAAGHGWYIDSTPLDNSDDYLPTSNPNIWQAKAGSDAAGKMDLLSVLLHEYGHALGLDHSPYSGDFMAATLKPGERRLPSAEELQLMSELVAQLKAGHSGDQAPTTPSPLVPSVPL
jgi:hypothetical protein